MLARKILLTIMSLTFLASMSWAQTRSVSGTVQGDNGAPLVVASVTQKNSTKGTVTDANGKFIISLPAGKVSLVINSVGYTSQEVAITNQTDIKVQLVAESKSLEDVVVVGYGSVRKKDLTGAVGSVSSKDIVRTNPSNATQALQGQVTGVVITKIATSLVKHLVLIFVVKILSRVPLNHWLLWMELLAQDCVILIRRISNPLIS